MTVLRITDHATRAELEEAIAELRRRAKRYSANDRRRLELDEEVDHLVDDWMAAES